MNDKIIISICGAAGTGKSQLAKKLVQKLERDLAVRIPADYFLKSYNNEPYEEYINTSFKYDWAILKKIFKQPILTECSTPDFDFNKLVRLSKTGGIPFIIKRYLILDGSLPYPESDYLIKLEAPADLRLKRIKERDKKNKTYSERNWQKMERTAKELESRKYKFNLMLNGEDDVDRNVAKIFDLLKL